MLVELTSLVVESVSHLMSDNHTDSTVVYGIIRIEIEERRLENACGEADLVCCGIVVCIDSLRTHVPAGAVDGLTVVGKIIFLIEEDSILDIGPVRLCGIDIKLGVVAP